ncbi:MAG: PAS domain-containing protein [Deltaproteobacteria bacterium]|nr:PAS domain-containing protein [Deltaproteobacteria bacterium]
MADNKDSFPDAGNNLIFKKETDDQTTGEQQESLYLPEWKIIIADDQEEIHTVTKLVLDDFSFEGRKLKFLNAYSGKETKQLVSDNNDIAFILLDVVMETDDAGLEVVRYIREELKNNIVQIVLNTGQPGQAPEHEVITKYAINDYKSKTEFNAKKLITSITSALRAYSLSSSLHQANEQLNEYRYHLEDLVKQRTLELEKENEERKRAEQALRQSNEIQADILTASPVGICLIKNSTIEWANEAMRKIFGFENESNYRDKDFKIFFSSTEEHNRIEKLIIENLKNDIPIVSDALFQKKNKAIFTGNLNLSCKDPSNYQKQAVITISDISWRKQAEHDKTQKERLQGALEMSGSICHELNQPLQYISGATEILLMDMKKDDPIFEMIAKVKTQVERMGAITKKLMGITSYKTREYVGGRKIIDIDKASN